MARTLTRDPGRAVLGGVAAGFGRYLDVDPVLVRLAFVILFFANGIGLLLYLASWALMPKEGAPTAVGPAGVEGAFAGARDAAEEAARAIAGSAEEAGGARLVVGYCLIALGVVLLLHNLDWIRWPHWARLEVLWPIVLVGMGAGLVHRSLRRKEPA